MTDRRIDAFFYGLFMDVAILRDKQVAPANPRPAFVEGFELRIGPRATLLPHVGARAYGMLFALKHSELERLYIGPDLELYRAEAVLAQTLQGEVIPALCYNLPEAPSPDERNPEYAARLKGVLRKLNFPEAYVESLV